MKVQVAHQVSLERLGAGARWRSRWSGIAGRRATLFWVPLWLAACDTSAAGRPSSDAPPSLSRGSGELAANEVLLIGDSYVEVPNRELNRELSRLARAEGLIGQNESFRDNAISGTRLAGGLNPIPGQYATAQQRTPAKVLIMDGGGNDIIAAKCANCAALEEAVAAARALFQQLESDGTVEHIILFFYPDLPNFPALRADAANFMRPRLQSLCESARIACHFLDLRPIFQGHPEFIAADDLHPTLAGSDAMAQAIFELMQANPSTP